MARFEPDIPADLPPAHVVTISMYNSRWFLPVEAQDAPFALIMVCTVITAFSIVSFVRRRKSSMLKVRAIEHGHLLGLPPPALRSRPRVLWPCARSVSFASQVRQLRLILIQLAAVFANLMVPLYAQLALTHHCTERSAAHGVEAALHHVRDNLQLPWDAAVSVDACTAHAALDQTLGPTTWTTERVHTAPVATSPKTDRSFRPIACGSYAVLPLIGLHNTSIGGFQARTTGMLFAGATEIPDVTVQDATVAARRALSRGGQAPTQLPLSHPQSGSTSAQYFARFASSSTQLSAGFGDVLFGPQQWFQCASRRGGDIALAESDCRMDTVWPAAIAFVFLAVTVLRIVRLADMAEVQAASGAAWATTADEARIGMLRRRNGGGLCGSLARLAKMLAVPTLAVVLAAAFTFLPGAHPCIPGDMKELITLFAMAWFLPGLVSRGLVRAASLKESLGLRRETVSMAVVAILTISTGVVSRAYLFQYVFGVSIARMVLYVFTTVNVLILPVHIAAVDHWDPACRRHARASATFRRAVCLPEDERATSIGRRGHVHGGKHHEANPGCMPPCCGGRRCSEQPVGYLCLLHQVAFLDNTCSSCLGVVAIILWLGRQCCPRRSSRAEADLSSDEETGDTADTSETLMDVAIAVCRRCSTSRRRGRPGRASARTGGMIDEADEERITVEDVLRVPEARALLLEVSFSGNGHAALALPAYFECWFPWPLPLTRLSPLLTFDRSTFGVSFVSRRRCSSWTHGVSRSRKRSPTTTCQRRPRGFG